MNDEDFFDEDLEEEEFFPKDVHHISASKIADQFWCEMQLHLKMQLGFEPTEEMVQGTNIHRNLEEELGPVIDIIATTPEDSIVAYILQMYTKLDTLIKLKITRELPVIGKIEDIPCLGIIDQLEIKPKEMNNEEIIISDFKTRKSRSSPTYEQKRRNRIQLQVYWHLLNDLKQGKYTKEMFMEYFEMNKDIIPSDNLLAQLPDEHCKLLQDKTPNNLLSEVFQIFKNLPNLSLELHAIYLHQEDKSVVNNDISLFHLESFEVDMAWAVGYWKKIRTPNSCSQQWMCKYCQFSDNCSYFLKKYLNDKK
ncbi:MAG: PD-(D/E)XK nuclease family protein [Candidatus Thorarchaeota archaeon]